MVSKIQLNRFISSRLPTNSERRIVLLTGARQTGKTTSVQSLYPHLPYFNPDSLEYRLLLSGISSFDWGNSVGNALGPEWNGCIIVYQGNTITDLCDNIWAVPSWRLLS